MVYEADLFANIRALFTWPTSASSSSSAAAPTLTSTTSTSNNSNAASALPSSSSTSTPSQEDELVFFDAIQAASESTVYDSIEEDPETYVARLAADVIEKLKKKGVTSGKVNLSDK